MGKIDFHGKTALISGAGLFPVGGMAANCSTKAAMVSLANVMNIDLRQDNINVSVLCSGFINSKIINDGNIKGEKTFAKKIYGKIEVHPSDIAKAGVEGL